MNLNVSTVVSFDPEVKALLDRLASDIQALQLRAKLTMVERQAADTKDRVARVMSIHEIKAKQEYWTARLHHALALNEAESYLKESDGRATAQATSEAMMPDPDPSVPAPAPAPEPSAPEPVEMESSARQRLKDDADATAQRMFAGFDLMKQQGQSTATSLAYALRVVRQASAGFECSQTMEAILHALDGMDAAAREEQSNG